MNEIAISREIIARAEACPMVNALNAWRYKVMPINSVTFPGPPRVIVKIMSMDLNESMVRKRIPNMRINFPWGSTTWTRRWYHERFSTSAASNSALGTDPRAARVIIIMNGVHIQVSTSNTDGKAQAWEPRKSMVTPKTPLIK